MMNKSKYFYLLSLLAVFFLSGISFSGHQWDLYADEVIRYPTNGLPTMVDFGAKDCIPCKMMEPVLERVREKYDGEADILFIDIKKDPLPRSAYRIRVMPTQVFYSKNGTEVIRHEGFLSEKAIEHIMTKYLNVTASED